MGKGAGDLYIKAECRLLIQIYELHDMWINDDASTNKVSSYIVPSSYKANMSYNSSEKAYTIYTGSGGGYWSPIRHSCKLFDTFTPFEVSVDFKFPSTTQLVFGIINGDLNNGYGTRQELLANIIAMQFTSPSTNTSIGTRTSSTITTGKWYTLKVQFKYENSNVVMIGSVYDGSTLVSTQTDTIQAFNNGYLVIVPMLSNIYVKNIKAKPL